MKEPELMFQKKLLRMVREALKKVGRLISIYYLNERVINISIIITQVKIIVFVGIFSWALKTYTFNEYSLLQKDIVERNIQI